jgi:Rrf2 family nitric oxide-sensitive transcriptional repressor
MTLYTNHAVTVLVHLAAAPRRLSSIGEIATAHRISHNHLMKVVNDLAEAGFVEAVRDRSGGIRLSRPAREISLGEIVRQYRERFRTRGRGQRVSTVGAILQRRDRGGGPSLRRRSRRL